MPPKPNPDSIEQTSRRIAAETGLSRWRVRLSMRLCEASPELYQRYLDGELALNHALNLALVRPRTAVPGLSAVKRRIERMSRDGLHEISDAIIARHDELDRYDRERQVIADALGVPVAELDMPALPATPEQCEALRKALKARQVPTVGTSPQPPDATPESEITSGSTDDTPLCESGVATPEPNGASAGR